MYFCHSKSTALYYIFGCLLVCVYMFVGVALWCIGSGGGSLKPNGMVLMLRYIYTSMFYLHICCRPPAAIPEECFNDTMKVIHAIIMHRTHTNIHNSCCQCLYFTYPTVCRGLCSMHVCTYITFRGASKSHTGL